MRIGFVVDSGGLGGAERQAIMLAERLQKNEHEVLFFFLNQNGERQLEKYLKLRKIPFFDLKFKFKADHIGRVWNIFKLAIKLRKFEIDVYMPYTIRPNVNINFLWQLTGARRCIWNQRDEGRGFTKQKYRDKILWFALKNTSGFISNSIEGLQFVESYIHTQKPMITINNGVIISPPQEEKKTILKGLEIPSDTFVAIMIANLTRYKDHETLLKAWQLFLKNASNEPIPLLLLAGKTAETTNSIKSQIAELGIGQSVKILGSVEDINSLIHACDVCVHSSEYEGVPNGILESMAAEKPVIASDILGIREALGTDYPFLSEVGNAEIMANQLLELFLDIEKRSSLGRRNKRRIAEEFDIKNLDLQTLKFINLLLNE